MDKADEAWSLRESEPRRDREGAPAVPTFARSAPADLLEPRPPSPAAAPAGDGAVAPGAELMRSSGGPEGDGGRALGAAAKHGAARRDGDADEGMEQLRAPVAAEPDPEAQDTDSGKRPRGKGVLAAAEARRAVVQAAVPHVA